MALRNKGIRRSISSGQMKLRQINIKFDGGTDTVSGFDRFGIKEVIDGGAGLHTFVFNDPFERDCQPNGHIMLTADSDLVVTAVAYDRVTVQARTAGVAADAAYSLAILGSDGKVDY